jgi:DNA-binding response OmpR family regulator
MIDPRYFPSPIPFRDIPNNWVLLRNEDTRRHPTPQLKSFDVLIVEDDPVLRRTIAFALQSEGYSVMGARDGADALRVLGSATPWLILLDLRLPGMNGIDFAAEVHARGIPTQIAVVTGTRDARQAALEIGATDYLAKPFEVDDLVSLVHRHRAA